jgi:hypothetical protein
MSSSLPNAQLTKGQRVELSSPRALEKDRKIENQWTWP